MRRNTVSDCVYDEPVPVLLAGDHRRDEPPVDGGCWPVSVVGIPDEPAREVLAEVMREALPLAGPGHFETGRSDASHLTVRALEPYREAAAPEDPVTDAWVAALEEVGRTCPPVRLRLTGVTLTVSGVMVQAEPVDDDPRELMRRLGAALGPLAAFEDQWGRLDIWYASVVHFEAPVLDAPGLVDWARGRRTSLDHDVVLDALTLTRFRYSESGGGRHLAMEPLRSVDLVGRPEAGPHTCRHGTEGTGSRRRGRSGDGRDPHRPRGDRAGRPRLARTCAETDALGSRGP